MAGRLVLTDEDRFDYSPNFKISARFGDFRHQRFPIPSDLIKIISSTNNLKIYEKIIKTCKYFYFLRQQPPVAHIFFIFFGNSRHYHAGIMTSVNSTEPSNLWLTGKLEMDLVEEDQELLQKLIPRIYRCDVSQIQMHNQNLTEDEFFFLINPETVGSIDLHRVAVARGDGTYTPVEDILERLPNAYEIR